MRTMKVFDFRKIDYLLKHKQVPIGAGYKIKTNLTNKGIVLSSHQMDALSSFSFNCGVNALFGSSLYKYIIQGGTDANKIKTYFRMWNKANGQVSKGLDRRRIAEAEMFSYGVYNNN